MRLKSGMGIRQTPIAILDIGDIGGLTAVLAQRILYGNPIIPTATREEAEQRSRKSLDILGAKSWSDFSRNLQEWVISTTKEENYIIERFHRVRGGGFVPDPDYTPTILPPETSAEDVAARAAALIHHDLAENKTGKRRPAAPKAEPPATGPVQLPDADRIEELGDFLEWLANAEPADEADIRSEIKRYYYDVGDQEGGDALSQALTEALRPGITRTERQAILKRCDRYTRTDPAKWQKRRKRKA
jgi:hypothetical protein